MPRPRQAGSVPPPHSVPNSVPAAKRTHESRRAKSAGKIGRPVVSVQLPLERLAARSELTHLASDQVVELCSLEPGEVAIVDEPALLRADEAQERTVPLGAYAGGQVV